ncbi:MAG TPA: TonB-dependent receptor [Thermoanaerobaculia bacterium]|nr:TonB-dependent receptor [Thermoanaerobaculia bacterium]
MTPGITHHHAVGSIRPRFAIGQVSAGLLATMVWALATLLAVPATAQEKTEGEDEKRRGVRARGEAQVPGSDFSEEIFVSGTAGTVALSSSVATKIEIPLRLTPASVSVVTRALHQEQAAVTVSDALRNVSGVNIQSGFGQHDFFVVRGVDSLQGGLVLTDGIAEPEATFYHLYNVERVEVLKGPGGFLYGANPLSGTVNLLRAKPAKESFWSAEAQVGSFDTYRGAFDANFGSEPIRFRIHGLWRDSQGYRDGRESQALALNPVLDLTLGSSGLLRFDVEGFRSESMPDSGLPVSGAESFDLPRKRSYQSPFDDSRQDVSRARIHWETQLGGSWTLRNRAYFTELDWESEGTILNGVFPAFPGPEGLLVARTLGSLRDDQRWVGDQLEAQLGGRRHNWLFGIEVAERRDEFSIDIGVLPLIGLFDPVETATSPPPALPGFGEVGDAERRFVAPYVMDRVLLSDRWQLLWGIRVDAMEFEDAATGSSRSDEEMSPLLGLVYAPSSTISAYFNAGRSAAVPSTRAAGELEPEISEQVELGLKKVLLRGRMHLSAAIYQLEREDIAIFDDNGFTAQTGSQRSRGVEAELAGSLGNGLRYQIACSRTDTELLEFNERFLLPPTFLPIVVDRSGNDPAFAPKDLWNFWIAKTWSNGLGIGGGGRYVGDQFIAEDNVFTIEEALTFDATAFYDFEDWRVALNLHNLTDEKYERRGFSSSSVIPADGAAAFLTVSFRK